MIKEIKKKRIIQLFVKYLQEEIYIEHVTDDVTLYYIKSFGFIGNMFYTYDDKKELYVYNKRIMILDILVGLTKREIYNIIKDTFNLKNYKIKCRG